MEHTLPRHSSALETRTPVSTPTVDLPPSTLRAPMSQDLGTRTIFRSDPTLDGRELTTRIRGAVPEWLSGDLVRTAPAVYAVGEWRARHWFDGLGMIFAFRIARGAVRFAQHVLESDVRKRILAGQEDTPHFGTGMHRGLWARLTHPVPRPNDNTNVNCVPFGDTLVAMTETNVQHTIDRATLRSSGTVRYDDALGDALMMLAHPHADFARKTVVNVGSVFGARPSLVVYEHGLNERARRTVAKIALPELPYMHSFGLTAKHAVLFGGPYAMAPWRLLWSNKGLTDHMRWRPERGSTVFRVDRATGAVATHTAPAMFVFHTINTFERAGGETVHDVLAYDDPGIITRVTTERLYQEMPDVRARPVRMVLREGVEEARIEPLADGGFEFPQVDYRRYSGSAYRYAWGASNGPARGARGGEGGNGGGESGYVSDLVRHDMATGKTASLREGEWVFGEPVFVARPGSSEEGDGAVLSVASHPSEARSALAVVDARSMEMLAWCELEAPLPLGFHGSFVRG